MAKRGRPRKRKAHFTTKPNRTTSDQDDDVKPETSKNRTNKNSNNDQSDSEESIFPNPKLAKKGSFDELIGNQYDNAYLDYGTVKLTYANRKSNNQNFEYHDGIVEFDDNNNRDMILKWLNDNRNIFDRLTQTQEQISQRKIDEIWLDDMPSVSQNLSKISPKTHQYKTKSTRIKYKKITSKPRAQSLDIVITKEIKDRGRVKRHSITLDSRICDNDNIQQLHNENQNVKIVKMMEEEYLNSLDEVFRDYKNGWERMENIKKTIQKTIREKKQLDITLHNTQQQQQQQQNLTTNQNIEILNNLTINEIINLNYPVYNLDEFEDFICENIEKPSDNSDDSNYCCIHHNGTVIEHNVSNETNVKIIEKCENFIHLLEDLEINELSVLKPHYERIKLIFDQIIEKCNKETQDYLKPLVEDVAIQTTIDDDPQEHKLQQPHVEDAEIQTTIDENQPKQKLQQPHVEDAEIQTTIDDNQPEQKLEQSPVREEKEEHMQDSQLLQFFNFETDDFLKESQTIIENKTIEKHKVIDGQNENTPTSSNELVLMLTKSDINEQQKSQNYRGIKRSNDNDIDDEFTNKKHRPCERFIPDDLSIAFDSEEIIIIDDSNIINNDINKKTRTQELIEECDLLIQNATNQKLQRIDDSCNKKDTEEIFEENSMFINEDNISKINKDIDLFEGNYSQDTNNNSNKENIIVKTPVKPTNNNSRKNLFGNDTNDKTIIAEKSCKINIIENIVLKSPNDDDDCVIISSQNDDIVETTPQKDLKIYEMRNSFLDITLPPPLEFQDSDKHEKISSKSLPSLNRINSNNNNNNRNCRHSTPNSNKFSSDCISLSPITLERNPLDLANCSSLTIHMKPTTPTMKRSQQLTKQRSILNYLQSPSRSQQKQPSQDLQLTLSQKPCISCTRISNDQLFAITALTNKKLATYSSTFTKKVTHMIVSVDDNNCLKDHTIKYVSAVASGIWVLNFKWIQECLTKNCIVPEEQYEVFDMSGIDGPKQSRLKRTIEPLLNNYKIYAAQPFLSTTQQDVENIIRLLGGKIVAHPESLLNKDGSICVIITEAKDTQDANLYESWLELFKVITVDIEWLSRSVGQYRVLSFRPFSLCSDDSILSLGYPKELLAEVPFSFSQDD